MDKIIADRLEQVSRAALRHGVHLADGGVHVRLWAPYADKVSIQWQNNIRDELTRDQYGYHIGFFADKHAGTQYLFYLHDQEEVIARPMAGYSL